MCIKRLFHDLYEENGIINLIKARNLTDYGFDIEKYKENTLNLYVRTHFGFNKTCLKKRKTKFDMKELTEIISTAHKMVEASKLILRFGIAVIVLSVGESFIFERLMNIEIFFENLLSNGGSLYMLFDTLYYGLTYDDPYETNMECSDFVSNSNYNVMIEKIQDNGKILWLCCLFLIILCCLNFIFFILVIIEMCYKRKKCCCSDTNSCCCEGCINCFEKCFEKKENSDMTAHLR